MKQRLSSPLLIVFLISAIFSAGIAWSQDTDIKALPGPLALPLKRGICIDRQVHSIPPVPDRTVHADDVRVVRSLDFDFVKMVFNPVVFKSGDGLDASHMGYFDEIVNYGVAEKLPVVICIHPEWKYKEQVLGNQDEFAGFAAFVKSLCKHIAEKWTSEQVALQLMTEPPPSSTNPDAWNYWGTLQQRLWRIARQELPKHTLIFKRRYGRIDRRAATRHFGRG